jgi:transposase-like protein
MEDKKERRQYSAEFKRDAVSLVRSSGKSADAIGRELGVHGTTLGNWLKRDRIDRGEQGGVTTDQRTRIAELEKENARLRMEREILKRAAAFWVKESGA